MDKKEEIYEQILNKKFDKSVFTGYSTEDVDKFFDYVIEYLKQNEIEVSQIKKEKQKVDSENSKLKNQLQNCINEITRLKAIVKQFEDDGFVHVLKNKQRQDELNKKGAK